MDTLPYGPIIALASLVLIPLALLAAHLYHERTSEMRNPEVRKGQTFDPAENAVRKMSHRKLRKAAEGGNPLAQRILAEMQSDVAKKATKAFRKARRKSK